VKVDNFYVKNFFTNMRSICTAAIHEKYEKMGGLKKRVEVGNAAIIIFHIVLIGCSNYLSHLLYQLRTKSY
jgi:hypothetical protein